MKTLTNLLIAAAMISSPFAGLAKSSKKAELKPPAQLPAYKGKTKVSVDFEQSNTKATDGGIVLVNESITKVTSEARDLRKEAKATPNPGKSVAAGKASALPSKLPAKKTTTTVVTTVTSKESDAVVAVQSVEGVEPVVAATDDVKKMEAFEVSPVQTTKHALPINDITSADASLDTMIVETKTTVTATAAPLAASSLSSADSTTAMSPIALGASSMSTPSKNTTTTSTTSTTSATTSAPADFEDRSGSKISVTTVTSTTTITESTQGRRSVFIEGGYLGSRYDKLEADLKNGASTMSISLGLPVKNYEVIAALDVAHGLDQAVTPQNTRMLAARGGVLMTLGRFDRTKITGGGSVGFAGIDVRSYRGVTSTAEFTVKQHAMGTVMVVVPELGTRIELGQHILAQIAVRYYLLTGQEELSRLSALSASAGIGYDF